MDWYEWGDEAFARARSAGLPIFLSVGYSTCHWCHVMERESFENEEIARVLNERFVSIKVDREERPDVDRVYMAFVQATTGGGGWPMSVFLTPDLRPFFGGTYFPPDDKYGRPGFRSLLEKIADLWQTERPRLEDAGARVIAELGRETAGAPVVLDAKVFAAAADFFAQTFDAQHGGFGRAPKFPRPVVHDFLLRHFARTGDADAAHRVLATLHMMARGGMYDQLGGGFHRYSVDRYWHVPHFEKMLYDQAQLVTSYVEAWQVTHDPYLERIARETCGYVLRDLLAPEGGFYSAEDADSLPPGGGAEKVEGAYYIWTKDELDARLGDDAARFAAYYGVEPDGNADDPHGELTGKNVLHLVGKLAELDDPALVRARAALFAARAARPRPHRDEKILTSWNGLMISALARAHQAFGEPRFLAAATRAARFVTSTLWTGGTAGKLLRRHAGGEAGIDAYLDDHAALAAGLLDLYEAGFDRDFLTLAETITDRMVAVFHDAEHGGFFSTAGTDASVLIRLKDDYDGAEPAGTSLAARNLLRIADMLDRDDLRKVADETFRATGERLREAPHALPALLVALDLAWDEAPAQVVLAGDREAPDTQALARAVHRNFVPRKTILHANAEDATLAARLPWLAGMRPQDGRATAYVCRNHACERPTTDAATVIDLLPHRELA